MTGAQVFALVFVGVLSALAVVALLLASRRSWQERSLMYLAQQVNLAVPEQLEDELLRLAARRERAAAIGVIAILISVFLPLVLLLPEVDLLQGSAPIVLVFASGFVAAAVTALVDRRRGTFGSPSVGRLVGPSVGDLVPVGLVSTAAVVVIVGATLAVVATLLPGDALADAPPASAPLALVGVVAFAVWVWAARTIAHRRPITGDTTTLAWSDALRAQSIRDLLLLPVFASVFSLIGTVPAALRAVAADDGAARDIAHSTTFLVPVGIMITMVAIEASRWTGRHYQRRLWPELANPRMPSLDADPVLTPKAGRE